MATIEATFVQGDTKPDITATLYEEEDRENVLDLTTADSVRFQMRKPDDEVFTVDDSADVVVADQGAVSYSWKENDLSVPGLYDAQWEIHWNDGKVQTTVYPNRILVRRK